VGLRDPGEGEPLGIVAHASGRRDESLVDEAITKVHARSCGQPVAWYSDGWQAYTEAIRRAYRRPLRTGRVGRPPLVVPEGLSLTQTIKHRDERGRLLEVERRTTIGTAAAVRQPCGSRWLCISSGSRWGVQGPAGGPDAQDARLRQDRQDVGCAVWVVGIGAQLALRDHPALRRPSTTAGRRYERRTPAMEVGLSDHRWSWREFLTTKPTISY